MKGEKPRESEGDHPLVVTLGELVEAVGSFTDEAAEVAAVVDHVLQSLRSARRARRSDG